MTFPLDYARLALHGEQAVDLTLGEYARILTGETVVIAGRAISASDGPFRISDSRVTERHHGPGTHPGTGSPQQAHAGDDGDGEWEPREDSYATWEEGDALVQVTNDNGDGTYNIEVVSGADRGATYSAIDIDDLWEPDEDEVDVWTGNEPSDVEERAIRSFGVTDDPAEGGYILASGDMLDFSGKNLGGPAGVRHRDHREINMILLEDDIEHSNAPPTFQKLTRAIRMSLHGDVLGVDFVTAPTRSQKNTILSIAGQYAESVVWDVSNFDLESANWRHIESAFIDLHGDEFRDLSEVEDMLDDVPAILTRPELSPMNRAYEAIVTALGELNINIRSLLGRHAAPVHPGTGTDQQVHDPTGQGAGDGDRWPQDAIRQAEDEIVGSEVEQLMVFGKKGLLYKRTGESAYSISVDDAEEERLRQLRESGESILMMHNHPGGSTLSDSDVIFAVRNGVDEMVVVTDNMRYRLIIKQEVPEELWTGSEIVDFNKPIPKREGPDPALKILWGTYEEENTRMVRAAHPSERTEELFKRVYHEATSAAIKAMADAYPDYFEYIEEAR